MMKVQTFAVFFFGEARGTVKGRTMRGTARRYATISGIAADDADLEVLPLEKLSDARRAEAIAAGPIGLF